MLRHIYDLKNGAVDSLMNKTNGLILICVGTFLLALLPVIAAKRKLTETPINGPSLLAFDSEDNLYVVEKYGRHILKIDSKTKSVAVLAGNGKECCFEDGSPARNSSVYDVYSLAVDGQGSVYYGGRNAKDDAFVRKVDLRTGRTFTVAGRAGAETRVTPTGVSSLAADVSDPKGLVVTKSGQLIVAIDMSYQLAELAAIAKTVAGRSVKGFSGDGGLAIDAVFDLPSSLASDSEGNIYVADYFNHRIRRIDAKTQIITTVAGNGSAKESGDNGPATEAGLPYPSGIAIDSGGDLFTIGYGTVRRVDRKTGTIKTIAGTRQPGFSGDGGPATQAQIAPSGLALDSNNNLFISDANVNRIRRIDRQTGIISTFAGNGLPTRKIIIE
jgi:trimeric autotransporter adhesin